MKHLKQLLCAAAVVALGGLSGCTDGDETTISIVTNGGGGSGGTGGNSVCPSWALARSQINNQNVCQLPERILEDRILTSSIIWYLAGTVSVGNGNADVTVDPAVLVDPDPDTGDTAVLNVELTIEPGTQIVGEKGSFANMIITRGSQIDAVGTVDQPIIFSSSDDDFDGFGEWGGLIIHGYGINNKCAAPPGPCNVDSEGNSGKSGGYDDTDNSGRLKYVIVAEGGFEFSSGNEINGISLASVGNGTEMDYIQIDGNADDGIEFYGGAVNVKHLLLTNNLDDSVDWDEGFSGNLQYVLVIQDGSLINNAPVTFGNAIEADTEGSLALGIYSTPTIANATFIGDGEQDKLWVFKASSGGFLLNTIATWNNLTEFPTGDPKTSKCVDVVGPGAEGNINSRLDFNNIIWNCTDWGTEATDNNLIDGTFWMVDPQLDVNYAAQAPEASGVALDIAGFNAGNGDSTADETFFDDTDYVGAVDPAAVTPWFAGWSLPGTL